MAKTVTQIIKKTDQSTPYLTLIERLAQGKALREQAPRGTHATWQPPRNRRDPVDILSASNTGRIEQLIPIRFGRMSQSPFAFYRGAAALMAADLATTPTSGLRVQACGDAHLMNFGGFGTPERNIVFDINDLDETLPAPFEWDLKRLAASVVIAAKHIGLPISDASSIATEMVEEYRERMNEYAGMRALDVWYDKIDLKNYQNRSADPEVVKRIRKKLAERIGQEERKSHPDTLYPKLVVKQGATPMIKDEAPLIFHPTADWAPGLTAGYSSVIDSYRRSLPEHIQALFARFHFFDFAIKVVGVGSVGTWCGVALFMANDNDPLFLQVKEARTSVLEPYAGKSLHANKGQRVVAGQRLMQTASDAFLGWTRGVTGRDFYIRQLRDMKLSAMIEDWDIQTMTHYAKMCAHALARAHARSSDAAILSGYMGTSRTFDQAIGAFAVEYAAQNTLDFKAFIEAIRTGRIQAEMNA